MMTIDYSLELVLVHVECLVAFGRFKPTYLLQVGSEDEGGQNVDVDVVALGDVVSDEASVGESLDEAEWLEGESGHHDSLVDSVQGGDEDQHEEAHYHGTHHSVATHFLIDSLVVVFHYLVLLLYRPHSGQRYKLLLLSLQFTRQTLHLSLQTLVLFLGVYQNVLDHL